MSLQVITITSGYIAFFQTKYQLVSPLIPQSIVYEISTPYLTASLMASCVFLITLWLYFFHKKIAVLILATISLLFYQVWVFAH